MSENDSIEDRKANILMGLRGYKLIKKKKYKDASSFLVKDSDEKKYLIWCWPTQGTVGVQLINQVRKAMKEAEVERGLIITSGRYTQAAKTHSGKHDIELIPRVFPSFNIFAHVLVPKHEVMGAEEVKKVLTEYRIKPYQLPQLKASDPTAKAIGVKPGDIVRVVRDSPTAGKYISYRYVVEG